MARDEIATQSELSVPRIGVLDDVDVARGDQLSCPKRPNDPALGLPAGANEVARLGYVIATGHLAVGDKEVDALAGLGDPFRRAGPLAEEVCESALRPKTGVLSPGYGVVVELPLGRKEHVVPGKGAESTMV